MATTATSPEHGAEEPGSSLERHEHGHGEVEASELDEPSAEWGWHGSFPRGRQIAGWITVAFLLGMIPANYDGLDFAAWVLILVSAATVLGLVRDLRAQRRAG